MLSHQYVPSHARAANISPTTEASLEHRERDVTKSEQSLEVSDGISSEAIKQNNTHHSFPIQ